MHNSGNLMRYHEGGDDRSQKTGMRLKQQGRAHSRGNRGWMLLSFLLLLSGGQALTGMVSGSEIDDALEILTDSPWARMQTMTEVVSGVGSGEFGEKEIFNRFYVRILSAEPIQNAYQRLRSLLDSDSESSDQVGRNQLFDLTGSGFPPSDYIIIGVAFRSNQPEIESEIKNSLQAQTVQTLRNRVYLSTESFPRLQLVAYLPPRQAAVGARFCFPRMVEGRPVINRDDESFAFELDLPVDEANLRVTFPVSDELFDPVSTAESPSRAEQEVSEFQLPEISSAGKVDLDASRFAGVVNPFPTQQKGRAFHGSLYEYHRNDNLDARNFFDPVGEPLPEFKRNQFGGSLQIELGPRFNVFASYDGLRINQGSTLLSNVPSQAMKAGDFSEFLSLEDPVSIIDPISGQPFPGNLIPSDRFSPVATKLLPLIPDPNRLEEVRNYVNSQPVVQDQDTLDFRVDLGLEAQGQLSVEYEMVRADGVEVEPLPAFGVLEKENGYEASVGYTRTFGDRTVASWRVEFDRVEERSVAQGERPPGLLDSIGIEGVKVEGPEDEGYPAFELEGHPDFGDEGLPRHEVENRYGIEADLTFARGDHLFRTSGEITFRQLNDSRSNSLERGTFSFSGLYSGQSFADFLLGRADQATRAVGTSRQDLRNRSFEVAFVDEWRVHPQFTLSLGLGYQYFSPFRTIRTNLSVFRPLVFEPPPEGQLVDLSGDPTINTVVTPDRNDFRPRFGFAYRPLGDSRFVIRGSYSIFYESLPSWIYENYMGRNYPHYYLQSSQASIDSGGLDIRSPFETDTPTELAVRDIDPHLRTPYGHSWNLSFQQELSDNWTLELSNRGRRSVHDFRFLPANVPLPGEGAIQPRRPNNSYGQFAAVAGDGTSLFYELQFEIGKRFSDGFAFDARLEWRRRFDDNFDGDPSNPRNLSAEWAPSSGFPNHRFTLDFIYDLPFGEGRALGRVPGVDFLVGAWRLSGIARISSGGPFTVLLPGDTNNDGLSNDRPDRLNSGALTSDQRSIDRWFDTEAFAAPEPYSFGNAGRNILLGPPYHSWDLSLVKDFVFAGSQRLQVRFAFFNAFNHPNFDDPERVLGTRSFGVITGAKRAREIEIALKYSF